MSNMEEAQCRSCHVCQSVTLSNMAPPVKSTSMPTQPWRHLAAVLMGPLPSGESLLVVVDYNSRWMEVDVLVSTSSRVIIKCLERHFARYGVPESLRTDNAANLVIQEVEEFLAEYGVKHKISILYWLRANGEVERQNTTLLKAMKTAQIEGKSWSRELQKFLLSNRSTSHATTGVSPAELLFGRNVRSKLHQFEGEAYTQGAVGLEARGNDAMNKQCANDHANKSPSATWRREKKCSCNNREFVGISCLQHTTLYLLLSLRAEET